MSYAFVEYFGYALYKALGERVYDSGTKLLKNGTLSMKDNFDTKEHKDIIVNQNNELNDVLCVVLAFI